MAPRLDSTTATVQGMCPTKISKSKAQCKARFDSSLFNTIEIYQRLKNVFSN